MAVATPAYLLTIDQTYQLHCALAHDDNGLYWQQLACLLSGNKNVYLYLMSDIKI